MKDIKYEEKFICINRNKLWDSKVPAKVRKDFFKALHNLESYLPKNKYYCCNQDEPYADKVIEIILDGERKK